MHVVQQQEHHLHVGQLQEHHLQGKGDLMQQEKEATKKPAFCSTRSSNPAFSSLRSSNPAFFRGVGKVPTDRSFLRYLQSSDTGTRQFSDRFSLGSQFSDNGHGISCTIVHLSSLPKEKEWVCQKRNMLYFYRY